MYQYVEITIKVFQFYMHLLYIFPPRKWWLSSSFWWSLFSFILLCQLLLKTTRVAMDFSLFPAYVHVKTCHSRASIRITYRYSLNTVYHMILSSNGADRDLYHWRTRNMAITDWAVPCLTTILIGMGLSECPSSWAVSLRAQRGRGSPASSTRIVSTEPINHPMVNAIIPVFKYLCHRMPFEQLL